MTQSIAEKHTRGMVKNGSSTGGARRAAVQSIRAREPLSSTVDYTQALAKTGL
jgi:hypothetical protein